MPVYERKEFFLTALESALNQTVKCRVIVSDNCSSHDYFEKVCKEKNVEYFRNEENIGMAGNFAKGFERAETEFVLNLQDDDQLEPTFVGSFVKAYEEHPDIDIFFTDFVRLTEDGLKPHRHTLPFGYMENGQKIIEYGIKYKLGFPYIASAIKKTVADGSLQRYSGFGSYDWVWIYSEAEKISFYGDSRQLYIFRDHDNQDTKKNSIKYTLSNPYIYDKILKEKVLDKKLRRKASRNSFWKLVHFKSIASKVQIKSFIKETEIYGAYLKEKLDENRFLRLIFSMPRFMVYFFYKVMFKFGMIS